ncbi:SusC/RagA family TonB-linked outer membrane protein [Wenyingzhuangia sp. IMCC45467]
MKSCFYIILFLLPLSILAQKTITGTVTDTSKVPFPGASVLIKGTTKGVITDFDGGFKITLPEAPVTLVFSFLGYKTQEVVVNKQNTLKIVLQSDTSNLDEVILIGYGSSSRSDVTAAISTVKPYVDNTAGVATLETVLQGGSGIQVNASGEPGAAVSVNIRGTSSLSGSNQPLYVIDGIVVDSAEESLTDPSNFQATPKSGIGGVAPEDIESIQILKDASATAIYGSLGANGVVLITTKQGKTGSAKYKFSTSTTIGEAVFPYRMLNTDEYVSFINDKFKEDPNSISTGQYPTGRLPFEKRADGLYNFMDQQDNDNQNGIDTVGVYQPINWRDFYRATISSNSRFTVSGGTEKTKYYASAGYLENEGVVSNVYLKRADLGLNIKHNLNDKIKLGGKVTYTNTKNSLTGGASANAQASKSVYTSVNEWMPLDYRLDLAPLGDESYRITPRGWFEEYDNVSDENRFLANLSLDYEFLKDVNYSVKLGGDYREGNLVVWQGLNTDQGSSRDGRYSYSELSRYSYNIDQTIQYSPRAKKNHRYSVLGGVVYNHTNAVNSYTRASNYTTEGIANRGRDFLGATVIETQVDNYRIESLLSFLSRVTYAYKNRYKVSGTLRYDGSSKFVGDNRFGLFPALSLAWEMQKEPFMKRVKFIDEFKFRVGYGETGNQRVGTNLAFNNYRISPEGYSTSSGTLGLAYESTNIANEDLKWETQSQYNAGLDLVFFDNRLISSIDVYYKKSTDLLNQLTVGGSAGDESITINQGSLTNTGLEFSLAGDAIKTEHTTFNLFGNINFNKTKILSLGLLESQFDSYGTYEGYYGRPIQITGTNTVSTNIYLVDHQPGLIYGLQTEGILTAADITAGAPTINGSPAVEGFYKVKDLNGDGNISSEDRTVIGNPNPDFVYSFGTNFSYKNWSARVNFYGVYGNDIYNANSPSELFSGDLAYENVRKTYVNNMYSASNPTGIYPAVNIQRSYINGIGVLDAHVEDGSYLRLQNISIAYDLPTEKLKGITGVNVFVSAGNIYTWTKYTGNNPDLSSLRFTPGVAGVDIATPPTQKTFTMGVGITF